ncbi:MAG: hypothetical protein GWN84_10640 [Gammaproteobacteria bacterium]|nr:hypothetical protein [Gammaproteobacteria bacterium]NIR83322.1 hypothetical protein [Gammaproteobacteria bacterium]NIR91122.1 hypothetical protein [Gammaproteobacteria bacterium]NIU04489.1 hypothetical protein [Gammaproteobacteria bacterium]NIW87125.1 hypothetical protein [Gammaproteobacteria bacterium]
MFGALKRLWNWRKRSTDPKIRFDANGFEFADHKGKRYAVAWTNVTELWGYKMDLLTSHRVYFYFKLRKGPGIEISEEQPGFKELLPALKERFPGVNGWEGKILRPVPGRNETLLYRRTS